MARQQSTNNRLNNLPPEVNNYYETESRDKASMAWLIGLTSLVVTVGLALGVFFGGRWAYRQIRSNDTPTVATENQSESDGVTSSTNTEQEASPAPEPAPTPTPEPTPAPTPAPTPEPAPTPTPQPTPAPTPSPTPQPTPQPSPTPAPTPAPAVASSTTSTALVNTGPADTIAIFAATTILAAAAHAAYTKHKLVKN